jgi:hypothetical protein
MCVRVSVCTLLPGSSPKSRLAIQASTTTCTRLFAHSLACSGTVSLSTPVSIADRTLAMVAISIRVCVCPQSARLDPPLGPSTSSTTTWQPAKRQTRATANATSSSLEFHLPLYIHIAQYRACKPHDSGTIFSKGSWRPSVNVASHVAQQVTPLPP